MKSDIAERSDLELLLTEFYAVAMVDAEIGHHFAELDLESHLPVIVDFWEKVLLGKPIYFGNPLAVHQQLHEKNRLEPEHFNRWVEIFGHTVDKLFSGEMAVAAKQRARMIADNLDQRLNDGFRIQETT